MNASVEWLNAFLDASKSAVELRDLLTAHTATVEEVIALRTDLAPIVSIQRADHVQREPLVRVLAHLFQHQIHHRGQAHAMLSGSSVAPPQLDEFLLPSEAHLRRAEMAAMGWTETAVYGPMSLPGADRV